MVETLLCFLAFAKVFQHSHTAPKKNRGAFCVSQYFRNCGFPIRPSAWRESFMVSLNMHPYSAMSLMFPPPPVRSQYSVLTRVKDQGPPILHSPVCETSRPLPHGNSGFGTAQHSTAQHSTAQHSTA